MSESSIFTPTVSLSGGRAAEPRSRCPRTFEHSSLHQIPSSSRRAVINFFAVVNDSAIAVQDATVIVDDGLRLWRSRRWRRRRLWRRRRGGWRNKGLRRWSLRRSLGLRQNVSVRTLAVRGRPRKEFRWISAHRKILKLLRVAKNLSFRNEVRDLAAARRVPGCDGSGVVFFRWRADLGPWLQSPQAG